MNSILYVSIVFSCCCKSYTFLYHFGSWGVSSLWPCWWEPHPWGYIWWDGHRWVSSITSSWYTWQWLVLNWHTGQHWWQERQLFLAARSLHWRVHLFNMDQTRYFTWEWFNSKVDGYISLHNLEPWPLHTQMINCNCWPTQFEIIVIIVIYLTQVFSSLFNIRA